MDRTSVRWKPIAAVAFVLGVAVYALGGRAQAGPEPGHAKRIYVVRPGDTVWTIAQRSVGSKGDPRPVVDALVQANGLVDSVVLPGERLLIPGSGRQAGSD